MSKLDDLINELCPDGVEYQKLENCCEILDTQRKPISKAAREAGNYPYYGANGIQDYVSNYIFDGTFVLIGEDGSVLTPNGNPVVNWATGKIWVNNHAHILSEKKNVSIRYLFHYVQIINIKELVHGNIPKLTQGDLRNLEIPVPPLEIQNEIVRILDNFTELEKELEKELEARRRQYEYYRDSLLTFDDSVEWKTLGELCKIGDGLHGTPKYVEKTDFKFINGNNIKNGRIIISEQDKCIDENTYNKLKIEFSPETTVLMSINGTIGNLAFFNGEKIALGKSVCYFNIINPKLKKEFLYYFLQIQDSLNYFESSKTGSTIKNLGLKALREYKIPLLQENEQLKIINIIKQFDSLTNNITSGLPAEIEARHKQYEYYRDKLLTFKMKNER